MTVGEPLDKCSDDVVEQLAESMSSVIEGKMQSILKCFKPSQEIID